MISFLIGGFGITGLNLQVQDSQCAFPKKDGDKEKTLTDQPWKSHSITLIIVCQSSWIQRSAPVQGKGTDLSFTGAVSKVAEERRAVSREDIGVVAIGKDNWEQKCVLDYRWHFTLAQKSGYLITDVLWVSGFKIETYKIIKYFVFSLSIMLPW